jgi:hypothetical protein
MYLAYCIRAYFFSALLFFSLFVYKFFSISMCIALYFFLQILELWGDEAEPFGKSYRYIEVAG